MRDNKRDVNFTAIWGFTAFALIITVILVIVSAKYNTVFDDTANEKKYDRYFCMITDDRESSFMRAIYEGAVKAGEEQNIYVEMLGDNLSTDYKSEDLMRIAIAASVDGIILSKEQSDEMAELIEKANEAGIPVVTLNYDYEQSSRCCFVGVSSYEVGCMYGNRILNLFDTVDFKYNPVKILVLENQHGNSSSQTNMMYTGLQDIIEPANEMRPADSKVEISKWAVDDTNDFSVEESVRDIFINSKGELPDIIICRNELETACVYQAVVDYNKVGKVNILGYYTSNTILQAVKRGVIYSTIYANTERMGQCCVDALSEYILYGHTSQYLSADITLININNVDDYLAGGESND